MFKNQLSYNKSIFLIAVIIGIFIYFSGFLYRNFFANQDCPYCLGVGLKVEENNIVIKDVIKNSPAFNVGLEKGDKIVALNGYPIASIKNFQERILQQKDNGFSLNIFRGKQNKVFWVKITEDQRK